MNKVIALFLLALINLAQAGCPDGSQPDKSVSEDGTYFVFSCGSINNTATSNSDSSSNRTSKLDSAKSGISIENDPNIDFFKPPIAPYPADSMYWWGRKWQLADYNNDGFIDVLYVGVMRASNFIRFNINSDLPGDGEVECDNGDK